MIFNMVGGGGSATKIYGFHVSESVSAPASMITYLDDAVGMTPAYMDFTNDVFEYGDWEDAFFMPKPCMLKYDGTVDYYLNPYDYTRKANGASSDVANTSYGGNAMMQFPQIWTKYEATSDGFNVYIANKQVDSSYHAYSFINSAGDLIDYCYMPIYNGANVSSKLRSMSGLTPVNTQTASTEITYALANNTTSDVEWYTEVYADIMLVNSLLMLIGKNTNTQAVFGYGYCGGSSSSVTATGGMNTKGLFWGTSASSTVGVKVFGMEHWWGNIWRRYAGHINASGTQKIKMTYGTQDGSTASGYNTDGSGYLTVSGATPSGTSNSYISQMTANAYGYFPTTASGSESTYYCDVLGFDNSLSSYAIHGGYCLSGSRGGGLCCGLGAAPSLAGWNVGATISCKPLA